MVIALLITGLSFFASTAFADHPNEGTLELEQLQQEGDRNNFEIRQAEHALKGAQFDAKSRYGSFLPQVSLEGGPLATRFNDERVTGTAFYGRADWNLYRGGLDDASLERSKSEADFAQRKFGAVRAKQHREINRIYYEMLFLLESASLKERALQMNAEQMKLAKLKKSSGFTSNADVIEFELREATIRSDLILLKQENEQRSRELSLVLGRSDDSPKLVVKGHLEREKLSLSRDKILPQVRASNIDLTEARTDLYLNEKNRTIAYSGFLPRLDFEARYGRLAFEDKISSGLQDYTLMLRFSIPLFSGLETLNLQRAASARVASSTVAATRKNLGLAADVDNTLARMAALSDRLDLEERNLTRSEDYYKITLGEYRRGVKNSPDMVGASEKLLETRIRNLEYRRDYYLAKLALLELLSSDTLKVEM